MKRKNNSSLQLVTKGFLKSELKRELDALKNEIDENAKQYRDQILTKLDGVMGELGTMREEDTIGTYQTVEIRTPRKSATSNIKSPNDLTNISYSS